jgi:uncharacterized membrane protein YbhN (UPF0104 family)
VLDKFRQWGNYLVCFDLLFTSAWFAVVAVFALIGVVVAVSRSDYDRIPALLITFAAICAIFWFAAWVSRDARRTTRDLRQRRRARLASPDESPPASDTGDAAGIAAKPCLDNARLAARAPAHGGEVAAVHADPRRGVAELLGQGDRGRERDVWNMAGRTAR